MKNKSNKKYDKLFKSAESQQGYFTAKQAEQAGFYYNNFTYHVKSGLWVREGRGIYRIKNFPTDQIQGQYVYYSLWSRNKNDMPQGVYSHETALSIFELSDINPSKIHMTVHKNFRKSAIIPKILKLYYQNINQKELETKNGYKITSPLKTLIDLILTNETSMEFIEQAFEQAISRGLIPIPTLRSSNIPNNIKNIFKGWLTKIGSKKRAS